MFWLAYNRTGMTTFRRLNGYAPFSLIPCTPLKDTSKNHVFFREGKEATHARKILVLRGALKLSR